MTWPQHDPEARQGVPAAWTSQQAERDQQRVAWMIDQYQSGRHLITVGFDSLRLGRDAVFAGMQFASSPQAIWSFGKQGAKHSKQSVTQSADRLLSAANHEALPELIATCGKPWRARISIRRYREPWTSQVHWSIPQTA